MVCQCPGCGLPDIWHKGGKMIGEHAYGEFCTVTIPHGGGTVRLKPGRNEDGYGTIE